MLSTVYKKKYYLNEVFEQFTNSVELNNQDATELSENSPTSIYPRGFPSCV